MCAIRCSPKQGGIAVLDGFLRWAWVCSWSPRLRREARECAARQTLAACIYNLADYTLVFLLNRREKQEEQHVQGEGREWERVRKEWRRERSPSPRVWRGPVTGRLPASLTLPRSNYKATQPNKYPSWSLDWAFLHPTLPSITLFLARLEF